MSDPAPDSHLDPGPASGPLSPADVARFEADGFVALRGAVPRATVDAARAILWRATGCDPDDPSTWTDPVVRLDHFSDPPFRDAATAPVLHAAFDQLVGPGGWQPRGGLGTFPVRFPSDEAPGDDGWHVEASYAGPDGAPWLDLRSTGRALLLLFLFSDVGPDDAPTRIRVGSHADVVPFLAEGGETGVPWADLCEAAVPASAHREEVAATGRAGDVFLCHPFLVHAAQPHRGRVPRFMAQPPLLPTGALDLDVPASDATPVARPVLHALGRHG